MENTNDNRANIRAEIQEKLKDLDKHQKANLLSLFFTKSISEEYEELIDLLIDYKEYTYISNKHRGFLNAAQASYIALFDLILEP